MATARWPSALSADLALAGLAICARLRFPLEPCDDAFIVLRAVRHALAGVGPHFEPAHADAVLSTFLWPALVALPAGLGVDPLLALGLLGLVSEVALALVARRLATELSGSLVAGVVGAAALATHPVLLLASLGGMETAFVLALVAGGALALARGRFGALAVICAVLPWARVDAALAAAVFLVAGFLHGQRTLWARRRLLSGALVGAAAFAVHDLVYGTWLPTSVTAKIATGSWAAWEPWSVASEFAAATFGRSNYWLVHPTPHLLLVPFALWGLWRLARDGERRRLAAPLGIWVALYVGTFVVAGRSYATNFPWYFAPPLLGLAVFAAIGSAPLFAPLERRGEIWRAVVPPVAALSVWLAVAPAVGAGLARVRASFTTHRERSYATVASWLALHGGVRTIASNEVGTLGWFSPPGTEIVDLVGLSRRAEERGLSWLELIRRQSPDVVVSRADFRYRRELAAAEPERYRWLRAGALDVGLAPELYDRLAPYRDELARIFAAVDLEFPPDAPPRRSDALARVR